MDTRQPNIVLISADQLRHDWLGYRGADWVNTPNIDALAQRGVTFSGCCATAPLCAPARISLATGLSPMRFAHVGNSGYLPLSRPTYYQRLRDAGYHVAVTGKLDLAKPDEYNGVRGERPITFSWGFTHPLECEGKMHAGRRRKSDGGPLGPYGRFLQERGVFDRFADDYARRSQHGDEEDAAWDSVLETEEFADVYIGQRAADWIRTRTYEFPWHLVVNFVGPHNPFDPPTEYADHFRAADMPEAIPAGSDGRPDYVQTRMNLHADPGKILAARRQYAAAIEVIDDQVGQLCAALEERGELESTWIVFTSDHGEMLADHGLWTKKVHYESALRVPLLIAGPGLDLSGETIDVPVEGHDLNPTICELAGVSPAANIDAKSLLPVLRGLEASHRPDCFSVLHEALCLRTPQYKLIASRSGFSELYDLEQDPNEQHNIAGSMPEMVQSLQSRLQERYMEGGAYR